MEGHSSEECLTDSLEDIPSSSSRDGTMSMRDLRGENSGEMEDMTRSLTFHARDSFKPKLTRSASINLGEMSTRLKPRLSQQRASLRLSMDNKSERPERNERFLCSAHRETPRENKTSRRRRQMSHETHVQHESCTCRLMGNTYEYLTPLQRKDKQIKELKEDIKRLQSTLHEQQKMVEKLLDEKEKWNNAAHCTASVSSINITKKDYCNGFNDFKLNSLHSDINCDILNETFTLEEQEPAGLLTEPDLNNESDANNDNQVSPEGSQNNLQMSPPDSPLVNGGSIIHVSCNASGEKNEQVDLLTSELQSLRMSHESLVRTHESTVLSLRNVQESLQTMQDEMERREAEQAELFLRMFKKGQQSAQFERQDELEIILADEPYAVSLHEMTEKLKTTEAKLEFWQSLRTKESYDQQATSRLTDSEVTLQFVKASLFHYMTDRSQANQHLKAMIGIMGYSDSQLKSLEKLFSQSRKKRFNLKAMKASFNMMKF